MSDQDLTSLGDKLLDIVGDRAQAAVTVTRRRAGLTRFANSFVHQNVVEEHVEVALTLSVEGRPAGATTLRTDDKSMETLASKALGAARLRPVDPAWPGLAPPSPLNLANGPDPHYDQATANAGPAERAALVAAFVGAGQGLASAGFCQTTYTEKAFVNSAGQRLACRETSAAIDGIHSTGRSDGVASSYSTKLSEVDAAALGARAATRARSSEQTTELAAGNYEVVLEPRCVAYIMDFFSVYAFNGKAANEGRSFVRLGEAQLDPAISIWDDATDPRHMGQLFDGEGTPKARLQLVDAGVMTGLCHDRRSAAKAGDETPSTGHATAEVHWASVGPLAANLFVGASGRQAPKAPEELVRDVEDGLLVCDLWYTRVLDPKTLVATGLTRNGVFRVRDGEVAGAVSNLRFTQSYASALGPGHVLGIGNDAGLAPGGLHLGTNHTPSLHLSSWHFTGNASN